VTGAGAGVPDCAALLALADLLMDTARVVAQLGPEEYTDSDVPGISGSIGGHVRHCLDHVRALELGIERGLVDYDARRPDITIETEREAAAHSLMAAAARLRSVPAESLGRSVIVRTLIAIDGPVVEASSSVARELAFVVSHTIHHNAQIALLANRVGSSRLPRRFGVAPSTAALAGAA
jgi:uncharacterized damage-inducible protein DinB